MSVAVVVPWRGGCPHRERAWEWCRGRYAWPVTEAGGPDPWSKGAAVMPVIESCSADIVVVADADVWCDHVADAVYAVEAGAAWAMPHGNVHRLSESSTADLIGGADPDSLELSEPVHPGMWGGGIVALRRATALAVPLDPRFEGWGCEDIAWALALDHLAGKGWRGNKPLWHLWHPPQDRVTRKRGCPPNEALRRRYFGARYPPNAMRELAQEARDALDAAQQAMHDPAPVGDR